MPKFTTADGDLFIDGKKVLKAWESFSGWYWFGVEIAETRTPGKDGGGSMLNGREVPDVIWFGLVQGFDEDWGYFSEAEIKSLGNRAWKIPKVNFPFAGRQSSSEEL
ncbi:MAG: hypothetical protein MUP52_04520 [Candidatus Aminicenantes bacterium]|nr:hypothetical protein [Candidatus Aminicenantes bacterium]